MIILGVDPGSVVTGYGIIKYDKNKMTAVDQGIIAPKLSGTFPERLKCIYDRLCGIISLYKPDEFAIETAFYGKNVQSALKIGMARGISVLAAANSGIPITEYSPREVKKAVVGVGSATKAQVQYMVSSLLGIEGPFKRFDESDALSIAICHAFRMTTLIPGKGRSKNWKDFVEANPDRIVN